MTDFSVNSIKNRMIDRLKTKQSWQDLLFYSTNLTLIETFAEELHYLADFDVYLTHESKWSLAKNKSSLLSAQDLHNYKARGKTSAIGKVRVSADKSFDDFYPIDIFIPKNTVFKAGDVKFLSREFAYLSNVNKSIEIDVIQGEFRTESFIASGVANEKYNIDNDSVSDGSIEVKVNNQVYTEVRTLFDTTSRDNVYELTPRYDNNTIDVIFGDDIYGRKLQASDLVEITYIETRGANGNILGINQIDKVVSVVRDIEGKTVKLYCNNEDILIGGRDAEDIESIRKNATDYFQTGDRAVTRGDYETLIRQLNSTIDKIQVWGVYEYNLDNNLDMWNYLPPEENLVNVCALNSSLENLSESEKSEISLSLIDKKSPTDILRFYEADIIDIIFNVNAYVKDKSFLLFNVKNNIITDLRNVYGLANNNFFNSAYFSDYVRLIDSSEGVNYADVEMMIKNTFEFREEYVCDFTLKVRPVDRGTVLLYVKDLNTDEVFYVGKDNGLGNLQGEGDFTLNASFINYESGVGQVNISSSPLFKTINNYSVIIKYKVVNNNATLNSREQILSFNEAESDINTLYIM